MNTVDLHYEISITEEGHHFEIIVWKNGEQMDDPEWVFGWNTAKERALALKEQYSAVKCYRSFLGKQIPVK